jgi:hypothetical protein
MSLNIKEKEMTQFENVQAKWDKMWKIIAAVALGLSVISSAALGINFLSVGEEEAIARTSNVPCYFEQGGAKFVASSGCEVEVQSGGTLNIQSGATFIGDAGFDLNGNTLTWDADADTTSVASFDDTITTTLGAATGRFQILTGNLAVGNGTPDTTLNGEDAYVEGTLEVDGATNFDGASDFAATVDVNGLLTFGATPLYPLGNAGSNVEIVCATTSTFTASTTIDVTAMSVVSQVLAIQVTAPVTTAAFLYASAPTTTTFTLTSLTGGATAPFDAGTTGIVAHYCAIGSD